MTADWAVPATSLHDRTAFYPNTYDRHRYVHVAQSDQVTDLSTGLTMTPAALARRLDGIQPELVDPGLPVCQ